MANMLESRNVLNRLPNYTHYDAFDFFMFVPRDINVAIYGTGKKGEELFHFLTNSRPDIHIVTFVDSFHSGTKNGLPVVTPEALKSNELIDLVIICSVYAEQIIGVMKYLHIESYITFSTEPRFSRNFLKRNKKRLANFRAALHTDGDKALLDMIVEYRGNYEKPIYGFQEFNETIVGRGFVGNYLDYIKHDAIKCVYDCGSYIGDSATHFLNAFRNLESIYCFDAFCGRKEVQQHFPEVAEDPRVHFVNCGLSDKPATKYGVKPKAAPAGAALRDSKCTVFNTKVQCDTIDNLSLKNALAKPDFIKMDIENFEVRALNGGTATIQGSRAQFALSIYHSEQHLLEVFEYMFTHCSDYVYRLAHYNPSHVNKLILFAIPKELYG